MTSPKSNTKFKDKIRKELIQDSSINKFQEKVLFPDNPNEVYLRRTRIHKTTVYRTSDIDKANNKPLPGKKVESKDLINKCELIAEIEKQLTHLRSQQKYLQMSKETQQNQSWREYLSANQSVKMKNDVSKKECTEKFPNGSDNDTRQVCALLQVLIKKNCVKVTDSSTQIETPIEHKKINGEKYSPSFQKQNVHLSSDTSSVNVLWKGRTNSHRLRRTSVKMVNSSTQVGGPIESPKHRSTQVSIEIADDSNNTVRNRIRSSKQRLVRKQHIASSESSKSSPRFRTTQREVNEFLESPTNQRKDDSNERPKSSYKSLKNKLKPQMEKEVKTRNVYIKDSSKFAFVLKSKETCLSLTPKTAGSPSRSPKLYSADNEFQRSKVPVEEIRANSRKIVRSDNRNGSKNSLIEKKFHQIQQSPRREYKTTSESRDFQTSLSHQMTLSADAKSPIRNEISREIFTISSQRTNIEQSRQKNSPSQIIVSSTVQTRKASQITFIKNGKQSHQDCRYEHRVKKTNDLSRGSNVTSQLNTSLVTPNVIDDRTYIIPDTDESEDYIILPYVHNSNDMEPPPGIKAMGTTNYTQSPENAIEQSEVILEDASSRELNVNTSTTSPVLLNEMQDIPYTIGLTPLVSNQFKLSTRSHHNKVESKSFNHEARKSSNSDSSVRNLSFNSENVANKLESRSTSISALPQEHEVSNISRQLLQKNTSFRPHTSGLKEESIRLERSNGPRMNTPTTSRSNRTDMELTSDLTDLSITNQSHQSEIRTMPQPKLLAKNSIKSSRKENIINPEFNNLKDVPQKSESNYELQKNASSQKTSINSDHLNKSEDISYKIGPTSTMSLKYEDVDDAHRLKTDIFMTFQNMEHLSKSETDRKVDDIDIIRQTEPKVFKSDVNISTVYSKSEPHSNSDLELKSSPILLKSVPSANQSPNVTCSDPNFKLKHIAQSRIDEQFDQYILPQRVDQKLTRHSGSDTLKTDDLVDVNSKIEDFKDTCMSPKKSEQALITDHDKGDTNQKRGSISETGVIAEIPSEVLNYIQYLQNRLKDCDEMVEQTLYQREAFQSYGGLKVENSSNSESDDNEKENDSLRSLIMRKRSMKEEEEAAEKEFLLIEDKEEFNASLDSLSKFEVSCGCSCCAEAEEQSTSYHSDIPPFTGCDCMKEGYNQIMRLAYGK